MTSAALVAVTSERIEGLSGRSNRDTACTATGVEVMSMRLGYFYSRLMAFFAS